MSEQVNNMVSVCIATHNGERYIRGLLNSLLGQIGLNDEVIVSDDGSTDNTISIIKSLKDKRIHLFIQEPLIKKCTLSYEDKLKNIYLNFKNAILNAKGDYIFLCDQDDLWMNDKYTIVKEKLAHYPIVAHNAVFLSLDINIDGKLFFDKSTYKRLGFYHIIRYNPFLGCCMACHKSLALKAFEGSHISIPHDTWLLLASCVLNKKMGVILEPLLQYRIHESNNSCVFESNNSLFFKIKYRILLVINSVLLYCKNRLAVENIWRRK